MKNRNPKTIGSIFSSTLNLTGATLGLLLCAALSAVRADPGNDNRAPEVPADLAVPDGNKVSFHAYAVGVQIYTNDPVRLVWGFKAPEAVLIADKGGHGEIGIHYAGPTWESESGSKVVGARVAGAMVNSNAIPWLLLSAVTNKTVGPGIFENTTYIHRVNTTGGLAPATPPTPADREVHVPYTAEYYFYREQK